MTLNTKVTNNAIPIIIAGMIFGYMMEYELVDATNRKTIDIRNWTDEITDAVHVVLPAAIVDVFKDFYRITARTHPTLGELQKIGKEIAKTSYIGEKVTIHEYISKSFGDDYIFAESKKLFKRKEL